VGTTVVLRVGRRLRIFPDLAAASAAAADEILRSAAGAVRERGRFRWVISGGRTPLPLFERLGGPHGRGLPWGSTDVFFADERCVSPRDPASNYAAARRAFLGRVPIPRSRVHRIRGELRPASRAAKEYARLLGSLPARSTATTSCFDLVLLGIGPDGHTASLFPHAPALRERRRTVVAVPRAGQPPFVPRVTMTLPALGSSREVLFLVAGKDKSEALRGIFRASTGGSSRWPAGRVSSRGTVQWLIDRDAAEGLPAALRRCAGD
jgi:6-phosphogluconolactonase